VVGPFAPVSERSGLRRFVRFADGLLHPPPTQYMVYRSLFTPDELCRLLTDDFLDAHDADAPARWFCDLYEQDDDLPDELTCCQRHDLLTYLPDDLLVKSDIASMACGLELRAPMLDHRLVAWGLSLPAELKVSRRRGKVLLRAAMADALPAAVLQAPKRGFGLPLGAWLRGPLRDLMKETLLDGPLLTDDICRPSAIAGLINDHLDGRDDHTHRLWALMVLAGWLLRNQ